MVYRWKPFEDLNVLQQLEQINQAFEDVYGQRRAAAERGKETGQRYWTPPVEAWETEEHVFLSVDLPGMSIEDIDLQIEGEQLLVKGDRKEPEEKRNYKRQEKVYGPFFRAFNLTTPIDKEKVNASYKNGILEIQLPKSAAIKPKQIRIKVEEN